MKKNLLILSIAATGILFGCSEEEPTTPTPTPTGPYVVSTKGSYFIHNNTTLDINDAGTVIEVAAPQDSSVVNGTATYVGRSAVETFVFVNGVATDTIYTSESGTKVSLALPLTFSFSGAPLDFGVKWIDVFDTSSDTWTALNDTIPSFTINAGPMTYTGSAKLLFTGKKLGTENITVGSTSVATTKAEITMNTTLYVQLGAILYPLPVIIKQTLWFAAGIGLVQAEQPGIVAGGSGLPKFAIDGYKQSLVRYKVNP